MAPPTATGSKKSQSRPKAKAPTSSPRLGKTKVTKSTKEKRNNITKATGKTNNFVNGSSWKSKANSKRKQKQKQKQRGAGGTMRAFLDEASEDDDEEEEDGDEVEDEEQRERERVENVRRKLSSARESMNVDEDEDDDEDDASPAAADPESEDEDDNDANEDEDEDTSLPIPFSPEPDFILAEVVDTSKSQPNGTSNSLTTETLPLPLIHRILHTHFTTPDSTTITAPARSLVAKYVEIFAREAIRRCVEDKKERGRTDAAGGSTDTGWLDVEDLERVGVQLVLDF